MRYPNLLDSIFNVSTAAEHAHALIWRDVQWRERQPFLRLEPVVLADASGGTSIKPSGDVMSVPVTPGAFLDSGSRWTVLGTSKSSAPDTHAAIQKPGRYSV